MRTQCGCDSEQRDRHESGNQQTLHGILRWLDMQCGLHHRITANGHGRMCSGSPITILFLTCEPGDKCRTAFVATLMLAGIACGLRLRCSPRLTAVLAFV